MTLTEQIHEAFDQVRCAGDSAKDGTICCDSECSNHAPFYKLKEAAKQLEADAERYQAACETLGDDLEESKRLLSQIASPDGCEDAPDHASKCLAAFSALKQDAELGRLVRKMEPGQFLGREYANVLHEVGVDWSLVELGYPERTYKELGFGDTPKAALKAALGEE